MAEIESFDGKKNDLGCIGCDIESGKADFSGIIIKTKHFILGQDYETPIPGFFIINSRRHVASILDFSNEEMKEFTELLFRTRKAMKDVLGVREVAVFQNEVSGNSHFHAWILPKAEWMGGKIEAKPLNSILDYAKQNLRTKENLKKVEEALKKMRKCMEK